MPEDDKTIPVDEIKTITALATKENVAILKALAEFDEREEGSALGQLAGQFFSLKLESGSRESVSRTVKVLEVSNNYDILTIKAR